MSYRDSLEGITLPIISFFRARLLNVGWGDGKMIIWSGNLSVTCVMSSRTSQ